MEEVGGDERESGEVGRRGRRGVQLVLFRKRRMQAGREGVDVRIREGC